MNFSAVRINDFDHMTGPKRDKEVARTQRCVVDLLNESSRTEFPDVPVLFANKNVPAHVLDHAYTAARVARRAVGSPETFDWLSALSAACLRLWNRIGRVFPDWNQLAIFPTMARVKTLRPRAKEFRKNWWRRRF
jgi:hypothetical protein